MNMPKLQQSIMAYSNSVIRFDKPRDKYKYVCLYVCVCVCVRVCVCVVFIITDFIAPSEMPNTCTCYLRPVWVGSCGRC